VKILAINGSPRAGGNTETLTDAVLRGAAANGANTERIDLRRYSVHPHLGCKRCLMPESGTCVKPDDFPLLRRKVEEASMVLLATPLYWYTYSAQMKAFLDRWACDIFGFSEKVRGKMGVLLHVRGEKDPKAAEPLVESIKLGFSEIGIDYRGEISAVGNDIGEVAKDHEALQKAEKWGMQLSLMTPRPREQVVCRLLQEE